MWLGVFSRIYAGQVFLEDGTAIWTYAQVAERYFERIGGDVTLGVTCVGMS